MIFDDTNRWNVCDDIQVGVNLSDILHINTCQTKLEPQYQGHSGRVTPSSPPISLLLLLYLEALLSDDSSNPVASGLFEYRISSSPSSLSWPVAHEISKLAPKFPWIEEANLTLVGWLSSWVEVLPSLKWMERRSRMKWESRMDVKLWNRRWGQFLLIELAI